MFSPSSLFLPQGGRGAPGNDGGQGSPGAAGQQGDKGPRGDTGAPGPAVSCLSEVDS